MCPSLHRTLSLTGNVTNNIEVECRARFPVMPHPSLCVKLFDERKQFLPSRLMLYFRIVWGYTEILPNAVLSLCVTPPDL